MTMPHASVTMPSAGNASWEDKEMLGLVQQEKR